LLLGMIIGANATREIVYLRSLIEHDLQSSTKVPPPFLVAVNFQGLVGCDIPAFAGILFVGSMFQTVFSPLNGVLSEPERSYRYYQCYY
jgi:hypothetical protein